MSPIVNKTQFVWLYITSNLKLLKKTNPSLDTKCILLLPMFSSKKFAGETCAGVWACEEGLVRVYTGGGDK